MNLKLALAVLLLVTGCARNEPQKVAFRAMGQSVAVEEAPSDESIGLEVRRLVDAQGAGDMAGITIEVEDGVVTLRGVASSQAAAWRAESAARSVKGVKLVRNQVVVNDRGLVP
jgi:osmotically-inducible protein OsmY